MQALIRLAAAVPSIWPTPDDLSHHSLSTLDVLENSTPLSHDAFGTVVTLVLTAPSLFCKAAGPARPNHLARQITLQAFRADIVRALIVTDVSKCKSKAMEEEDSRPCPDLENLLSFTKELRIGNLDIEGLDASEVWDRVKKQCHSFLRCCCLFFHFLSDVIPPTELTVIGGDTWEIMCGYLNLPCTFKQLIDTANVRKKALEWSNMSTEYFNGEIPPNVVTEPDEPPKLQTLKHDFFDLRVMVSSFSCPNSEENHSNFPALCLVCGEKLCSQIYCYQSEARMVRFQIAF